MSLQNRQQRMEPLWSPRVVATNGNQRQIEGGPKRRKQAKTVAVGCDQLPTEFHGKEGVDGSRGAPLCLAGRLPELASARAKCLEIGPPSDTTEHLRGTEVLGERGSEGCSANGLGKRLQDRLFIARRRSGDLGTGLGDRTSGSNETCGGKEVAGVAPVLSEFDDASMQSGRSPAP